MKAVERKLAKLSGQDVDYLGEISDLHRFLFKRPGKPSHWLYVDRALISDGGDNLFVQRFEEFEPYLKESRSQRVTLTSNGIISVWHDRPRKPR